MGALFSRLRAHVDIVMNGGTPLTLAIKQNNTEIVRELLFNGANINHVDADGTSILHLATITIRHGISFQFDRYRRGVGCDILKLILSFGADVRHVNNDLKNALDIALIVDYVHGYNLNYHDSNSQCVALLYLGGVKLTRFTLENVHHKDMIPQFIRDDQEPQLILTRQCRKEIRAHLLNPSGGNHNNLFQAVPRLPLPRQLKEFLYFMENASNIQEYTGSIWIHL